MFMLVHLCQDTAGNIAHGTVINYTSFNYEFELDELLLQFDIKGSRGHAGQHVYCGFRSAINSAFIAGPWESEITTNRTTLRRITLLQLNSTVLANAYTLQRQPRSTITYHNWGINIQAVASPRVIK